MGTDRCQHCNHPLVESECIFDECEGAMLHGFTYYTWLNDDLGSALMSRDRTLVLLCSRTEKEAEDVAKQAYFCRSIYRVVLDKEAKQQWGTEPYFSTAEWKVLEVELLRTLPAKES